MERKAYTKPKAQECLKGKKNLLFKKFYGYNPSLLIIKKNDEFSLRGCE